MPHRWTTAGGDSWKATALDGDAYVAGDSTVAPATDSIDRVVAVPAALLYRAGAGGRWTLVVCPKCGLRYHQQRDTLRCWTDGDQCVARGRPTPHDTGFTWTPEAL